MVKQTLLAVIASASIAGAAGVGPLSPIQDQIKSTGGRIASQVAQYEATQVVHAAEVYRQAEVANALEMAASETKGVLYSEGVAHVAIRGPLDIKSCKAIDQQLVITDEECPPLAPSGQPAPGQSASTDVQRIQEQTSTDDRSPAQAAPLTEPTATEPTDTEPIATEPITTEPTDTGPTATELSAETTQP